MWKTWFVKKENLMPGNSPLSPIWIHPEFDIKHKAIDEKTLKQIGMIRIKDFYEKQLPITNEIWKNKIQGIEMSWLTWFQISKFINLSKVQKQSTRELTEWEKFIENYKTGDKGIITQIYKILIKQEIKGNLTTKQIWQNDLEEDIEEKEWGAMFQKFPFKTTSSRIKEGALKLTQKWYWTPVKLAKINKTLSSSCWRGCKDKGTQIHMWWECAKVKKFRNRIFKEIEIIIEQKIQKNPELALINIFTKENKEIKEKNFNWLFINCSKINDSIQLENS